MSNYKLFLENFIDDLNSNTDTENIARYLKDIVETKSYEKFIPKRNSEKKKKKKRKKVLKELSHVIDDSDSDIENSSKVQELGIVGHQILINQGNNLQPINISGSKISLVDEKTNNHYLLDNDTNFIFQKIKVLKETSDKSCDKFNIIYQYVGYFDEEQQKVLTGNIPKIQKEYPDIEKLNGIINLNI